MTPARTTTLHRALATYFPASPGAQELLGKYGALIERIARRLVMRTGLDSAYDDLWSAGALGLLEASTRFDAGRGNSFETFAGHRIRGSMLDELRRLDHLPRRLRDRTEELEKARHKLSAKLGRAALADEIASELDLDMTDLADIEALCEAPVALDSILATMPVEVDVDEDLDRNRRRAILTAAVESLPERLQILVSLHYVEGLSYREIAKIFDVSEPRVCQLHAEALKRLRASL